MRGDIKLDTTSGPKTLKDLLKVGLLNFYSTIRKWVPTMTAQQKDLPQGLLCAGPHLGHLRPARHGQSV